MGIFNLICKIIIFASLGWTVVVIIYAIIRRGIERKKAKKEALEVKEDGRLEDKE